MPERTTSELQAEERKLVESIRSADPTRVERPTPPDPDVILGRIGVTFLSPGRPSGYLRLYPHDFLVEEISSDGKIVPLVSDAAFTDSEDRRTLWVDFIKAALSGPHAITDLQHGLGLEDGRIGYSGIKDALAITSQRLSLRGVTKEAVDAFHHDRMLVRPVKYGSGALQPGDLKGNRFTIVVRGDSSKPIDTLVDAYRTDGFVNFFGSQRFGGRLNAQRLGQSLLKNDIEGALRTYFGEPGIFDVPLYRDIRLALGESFGDWKGMLEIAKHFPFSLRSEISVLESLVEDPRKTRQALSRIKDQVKLWIYAYGSWLMNRRLSQLVASGDAMPAEIALPISERGPLPEYRAMMEQDGTVGYLEAMQVYPYVQASSKSIPTRIVPGGLVHTAIPEGWVVRFSLGKGAYATSFLSHVFKIYEGLPVPDWVPKTDLDAFAAIGDTPLTPLRDRFAPVLTRRDMKAEESESPEAP